MLSLLFATQKPLSVLCLGAHSDDIEIGCAGTLWQLANMYELEVCWVTFSAPSARADEARASADALLGSRLARFECPDFQENVFPYEAAKLKAYLNDLRQDISPDVVFTHARHDRHQDHNTLSNLTWNAFRNHLILEYEIPKYDGDLGIPNVFVPLSEEIMMRKLEHLETHFASQHNKPWYDRDTFSALARLRGVECHSRYAEAFYGRKLLLNVATDNTSTPNA